MSSSSSVPVFHIPFDEVDISDLTLDPNEAVRETYDLAARLVQAGYPATLLDAARTAVISNPTHPMPEMQNAYVRAATANPSLPRLLVRDDVNQLYAEPHVAMPEDMFKLDDSKSPAASPQRGEGSGASPAPRTPKQKNEKKSAKTQNTKSEKKKTRNKKSSKFLQSPDGDRETQRAGARADDRDVSSTEDSSMTESHMQSPAFDAWRREQRAREYSQFIAETQQRGQQLQQSETDPLSPARIAATQATTARNHREWLATAQMPQQLTSAQRAHPDVTALQGMEAIYSPEELETDAWLAEQEMQARLAAQHASVLPKSLLVLLNRAWHADGLAAIEGNFVVADIPPKAQLLLEAIATSGAVLPISLISLVETLTAHKVELPTADMHREQQLYKEEAALQANYALTRLVAILSRALFDPSLAHLHRAFGYLLPDLIDAQLARSQRAIRRIQIDRLFTVLPTAVVAGLRASARKGLAPQVLNDRATIDHVGAANQRAKSLMNELGHAAPATNGSPASGGSAGATPHSRPTTNGTPPLLPTPPPRQPPLLPPPTKNSSSTSAPRSTEPALLHPPANKNNTNKKTNNNPNNTTNNRSGAPKNAPKKQTSKPSPNTTPKTTEPKSSSSKRT